MPTDPRFTRFAEAYIAMANVAKYRPQAPSDGYGHIQLSPEEFGDPERLGQEAARYAVKLLKADDDLEFKISGCTNFETNRAFVYAVEAAQVMCSGIDGDATVLRLLRMAIKEIESARSKRREAAA
jgi:hypothetical protein